MAQRVRLGSVGCGVAHSGAAWLSSGAVWLRWLGAAKLRWLRVGVGGPEFESRVGTPVEALYLSGQR